METKNQKLKTNNTASNLKKYQKHQNEHRATYHKNNNTNYSNNIFNINKNINNNNFKLLKLTQSNNNNNICVNEKEKLKINKKQIETTDNKLILGIEKEKEKVRQNSYSGLIKTEDCCTQNLFNKNISINKRSFLGKTSNFSPFKTKVRKDISINNENINSNIQKNSNNNKSDTQNKFIYNKNNQLKTLIKVKESKKKFKRTFSGYAVKRKSSMNNKNLSTFNFNINNKKQKTNFSQNKQKECNYINNYRNKNLQNSNTHISNYNNNYIFFSENEKSKNDLSKSAKKCQIKNYLNNTVVKSSQIKEYVNPIVNYKEKSPIANFSYHNNNAINYTNNEIIMNKTGNNFYENKMKKKFFNGSINNITNTNKNINKTENIISINLKDIETNSNKNILKNDSSKNNIINIKVKMTNKILPVNTIRDKQLFVEQNNQEQLYTTTKNTSKKKITIPTNNTNNNNKTNNINNNETTIKSKNSNNHRHNSAKYSKNKKIKIKNTTESKSQNKSTKINLEKQFNNNSNSNHNTIKKTNPNYNNKTNPSEKMNHKKNKEKEKSKGKEKELLMKAKKYSLNNNNDFSTITQRAKNIKGSALSTIKTNKTTNTNIIKCTNIDCIKKKFVEGPLPINEIKENTDSNNDLTECSFIINIISNWGNKKQVGITEIEIFDFNNEKIKINNIKIKGGGSGSENLNRLYNNKRHTFSENEMWTMDINNNNSQELNIYLYIYANIDKKKTLLDNINYIIIWNYNGWEVNKGVKKIEILKDDIIYFSGIITRGDHTILTEHPYKIIMRKKYIIKRNENQKRSILSFNNNSNSIKIEKYKHERERSYDNNFVSCNISVSNKNIKYNKMSRKLIDNDSVKNHRNTNLSFLKTIKRKSKIDLDSIFSTFKNHFSSSRSCYKEKKNNSYLNIGYTDKSNFRKNTIHNNYKMINSNSTSNLKSCNKIGNNNIVISNENGVVKNIIIKNKIYSIKNQSYDNKKKYMSKPDKILTNIKSIKFNNNIPKNIYNTLRNEDQNRKNIMFLSNTLRVCSFNKITQKNMPYISLKKIRINILSNYGHQLSVGLTGLHLIDNNSKTITVDSASSIGALPKDLRTVYENEDDCRIFENLFNDINNTIDANNMWLTLIHHDPYIEICFDDFIKLSAIEIWNFNEPMSLDNGVKEIELIFDEDEEKKTYNLFLWKGLGIDYYNYYQKIKCDDNYLKKLSKKYNKMKNEKNMINLPIGFIIKIVFISNYGDEETISLKKMEIFNEKNEKLDKYNLIIDPNYTINLRDGIVNDLLVDDYFYYHEFYDFHKNKDSFCNNIIYICFEEIVQIKCIKMDNTTDERFKLTSSKGIQIYCDDILFYEGTLKQMGENIINCENMTIDNNTNEDTDKIIAEENYKAYKEKIDDGIYRLFL